MGQVCSGAAEERKAGALDDEHAVYSEPSNDPQQPPPQSQTLPHQQQPPQKEATAPPADAERERLKAEREEQARRDLIVSAAGRGMVSVRSTRGSTGYYDQGFAAALAQHLEQTTRFPKTLPAPLPQPSAEGGVIDRLTKPQWEGIALGNAGGPAGCGGENPVRHMDHLAESLLDAVVPAKQRLFAGAHPMVENLL